jgi:hypothetical protein
VRKGQKRCLNADSKGKERRDVKKAIRPPVHTDIGAIGVVLMCGIGQARASSHREAPAISTDPAGGPNFHRFGDDVRYGIYIDNDADALEDISFTFEFETEIANAGTFLYNVGPIESNTDPNLNVRQTMTVTRTDSDGQVTLGSGLVTPPVNVGAASIPNYGTLAESAIHDLGEGIRVFAGPRDDPFYVDLGAIFDLLTIRPGAPGNAGGGLDDLAGLNCHAIVLQIPIALLTNDQSVPSDPTDAAAVIGLWSTADRRTTTTLEADGTRSSSGEWVQVSRIGNPLVNEVVLSRAVKDAWNRSKPADDGQFLDFVTDPEPSALLAAIYGLSVPPAPRNDLVQVFLTGVAGLNQPPDVTTSEQLRLNVAIAPSDNPNRLGVLAGDLAGFPNGRRLNIVLRAAAGVLVEGFNISPNNALGDGIDRNDRPFTASFPYLAAPHQGLVHTKHRREPAR